MFNSVTKLQSLLPLPIFIKKKGFSRKVVIPLTSSFIFIVIIGVFFLFAGRFLVVDEKPTDVDTIIVLSGGSGRIEKALELYTSGYAKTMIISNGLESRIVSAAAEVVPEHALLLETEAASTLDSAKLTKVLMIENDFESALVVSSDYHMRRVKTHFQAVFKKSNLDVHYVASNSMYNRTHWWVDKKSIGITLSEYMKLIGNSVGIHGNDAKRQLYDLDNYFYE